MVDSSNDGLRRFRVPSFCPVCGLIMRDAKSTASYYDWNCCVQCQIEFIDGREDRWRSGWRPNAAEVERLKEKLSAAV